VVYYFCLVVYVMQSLAKLVISSLRLLQIKNELGIQNGKEK
jgi:hypothetical protein